MSAQTCEVFSVDKQALAGSVAVPAQTCLSRYEGNWFRFVGGFFRLVYWFLHYLNLCMKLQPENLVPDQVVIIFLCRNNIPEGKKPVYAEAM